MSSAWLLWHLSGPEKERWVSARNLRDREAPLDYLGFEWILKQAAESFG